jgi:hypothetical protein
MVELSWYGGDIFSDKERNPGRLRGNYIHWNRSITVNSHNTRESQIQSRLQRLDRELMIDGCKRFEYIYAVRQGRRVKCCVMRVDRNPPEKLFAATASLSNRSHREYGRTPSTALHQLLRTLKWQVQQTNVKTFAGCYFKGTADILCKRCSDCERNSLPAAS